MRYLDDIITLDSFVTADHHWEHPRIREYQGRPEGHFWIMRDRWFKAVSKDDVVLHLGDVVCFGDQSRHPFWLNGLPGRKYLIRGNHDKHSDEWYEAAGFTVLGRGNRPWLWCPGPLIAFTHEPLTPDHINYPYTDLAWDVNVHGHVHANELWSRYLGREYVNVCVEVTNYAPIRLRDALTS